jgi:hypothetical protein
MSNTCPPPDTRNRYEGRGSGDRIARLKANATREGPKPTNQNTASWNLTKQQGCCQTNGVGYVTTNGVGYVTISNCSGDVTIPDNIYTLVVTNAFSSALVVDVLSDLSGLGGDSGYGAPDAVPVGGQVTFTKVNRIVRFDYRCDRGLAITACGQIDSFRNSPYLIATSYLDVPVMITITETDGSSRITKTESLNSNGGLYIGATPGYTIIGTSVSCP